MITEFLITVIPGGGEHPFSGTFRGRVVAICAIDNALAITLQAGVCDPTIRPSIAQQKTPNDE